MSDYQPILYNTPSSESERWAVIAEFTQQWCDTRLTDGCGNSEGDLASAEDRLGIKLPSGLRTWYLRAGKRLDLWCSDAKALSLDEIELKGDMLIIRRACQGVGVLEPPDCGLRIAGTIQRFGSCGQNPVLSAIAFHPSRFVACSTTQSIFQNLHDCSRTRGFPS